MQRYEKYVISYISIDFFSNNNIFSVLQRIHLHIPRVLPWVSVAIALQGARGLVGCTYTQGVTLGLGRH